jgi:hypothetical protein
VTSYSELELRSGASLRSVKDIIGALVACGVLERRARHDDNGMTVANRYRLIDLQPASDRGEATAEPWQDDNPTMGVHQPEHGGAIAERWDGELQTMTVRQPDRGGARRPAHARASDIQTKQNQENQTPSALDRQPEVGEGEGFPDSSDIEALCRRFLSSLQDILGPRRAARVVAGQHQQWRAAAGRLLEDFELTRLLAAIDYLRTDTILSGRARTLPEFAACIDEAVLRSQAAARRERPERTAGESEHMSWAEAWGHLRRAVSAYGRGGEDRAHESLARTDPLLSQFVKSVGWRAICQGDGENPTDLKFAWLAFERRSDHQEAA